MNRISEIYDYINEIAPFDTALSFDNVGLLVGNRDAHVSKVLLALDITKPVCEEAKKLGANLIISHHPVIFKPLRNVTSDGVIANLIKNDISAICAHTNLDIAEKGVNFRLAEKLSLSNLSELAFEENHPIGLIGYLEKEMSAKEFASFVKERLGCSGVRYTNAREQIKKVAVCSGSGGSFIESAYEKSADSLVTGEIKHSDILKANEFGISIVDAGHYKSENVIIEPLKNMLKEKFPNIEFFTSQTFSDKVYYL